MNNIYFTELSAALPFITWAIAACCAAWASLFCKHALRACLFVGALFTALAACFLLATAWESALFSAIIGSAGAACLGLTGLFHTDSDKAKYKSTGFSFAYICAPAAGALCASLYFHIPAAATTTKETRSAVISTKTETPNYTYIPLTDKPVEFLVALGLIVSAASSACFSLKARKES